MSPVGPVQAARCLAPDRRMPATQRLLDEDDLAPDRRVDCADFGNQLE